MLFSLKKIENAAAKGNVGFCVKCGARHIEVEPDARGYPCKKGCGSTVYGAEEIALMGLVK